jgi:uncharacterized membrane protein YjfL (UPF0719 family)
MVLILDDLYSAIIYTFLGGLIGFICLVTSVLVIPKLLNALTPQIDEEKEILKGNIAVAQYFGRIIQGIIIGISIIIAAAIISGIHGW